MLEQIPYVFESSYMEWSRIPVDDFDYMNPDDLMGLSYPQFSELVNLAYTIRWDTHQWRNKDNELYSFMLPNNINGCGKVAMDFGCGLGLDSMALVMAGYNVILADIHPKTLFLAQRAFCLTGRIPKRLVVSLPTSPWFDPHDKLDLFWSLGCLHHTPHIGSILHRACSLLTPTGCCKVVLYSDRRWQQMTGEPAPETDTWKHPKFNEFVRKCDTVGVYADWYNQKKLESLVSGFGKVVDCKYISNDQFIAATICKSS